ncbi:unnamed protein product [Somion occarium]|uniref:Protein kinase domain-containing protein n=1 Tax=Somion occarium TaxID=3059160 RepID=A0ABP1DKI2_9APHY
MRATLPVSEQFWRDHWLWLKERGYTLRPRYGPDWVPSWERDKRKRQCNCEDDVVPSSQHILDARNSKGDLVALKRINLATHPSEGVIARYFSSNNRKDNQNNHCVPLLDVLHVPEDDKQDDTPIILVMPFLRSYKDPNFVTVGEAVDFLRQVIQGLHYMHHNRVAHRHVVSKNFMMDPKPLYLDMFHPMDPSKTYDFTHQVKHRSRTAHPTKYYIVDLGDAREYSANSDKLCETALPREKSSAPEHHVPEQTPYDPFATDVYDLGDMFRSDFLDQSSSFEFLRPLISDMTKANASERPVMSEVDRRFEILQRHLSADELRSRVTRRNESIFSSVCRGIRHLYRRMKLAGLQPVPTLPAPSSQIRNGFRPDHSDSLPSSPT